MANSAGKKSLKTGFYLILIAVLSIIAVGFGWSLKTENRNKDSGGRTYVGASYVGSDKCRDCHQRQYWGWKETLHPYKIQVADQKSVVGDFYRNNSLTVGDYTTRMFERDGKYFVTTKDNPGRESTFPISYTVGGNQWKQLYLTRFPNGALNILPVQWNLATRRWTDYTGLKKFRPGDDKYWASPERIWQYKCGGCHATGLQINHDTAENVYQTEWPDDGAGCEACHGPGSEHIDASGEDLMTSIVNPAKLNFAMGLEVCGSCLIRGNSPDKKYGYPKGFRPGVGAKGLKFTYVSVEPGKNAKRFWKATGDSKSNHQQYIDYSNGRHAEAGVACWDCHDPHGKGVDNRFELKLPGNLLCIGCHGKPMIKEGSTGLSHTIHDFGSCVDCHMPRTAKNSIRGT